MYRNTLYKFSFLDNDSFEQIFKDNGVSKKTAQKLRYSFLQKVAVSGCIKKSTLVIERMTNARKDYLMNLRSCKFCKILHGLMITSYYIISYDLVS